LAGRGNEKKGGRRKSQNRYISPPSGAAISQPICTKFSEFVDLTDLIMPAKFGSKNCLYSSAMRYRAGL